MADLAVRAVLFDLDGTLVDNMPYHIDAWIETGRALGTELTRERIMRDFSGRRNEEIIPSVSARPLDAEQIEAISATKEARYRELYRPHLQLVNGAASFIEQLRAHGIACGVASAAPRLNREFVLNGLSLWTRVDTVVGGDEVAHGKPAPDIFLEAARRLGKAPSETLVFEDAVLGVQAGLAAGMRVCGVTTGESSESLIAAGAFVAIADFRDLPRVITALLGF
ncbi:MAG TPA: HAD family phosphatase [Polyangiales bacterium]|jgi:beta-phosphoglucomutase family hydrolase|nr:HAD family phosphatase [Polyangiales bacterium]